uniref:Pentatricopeptide repeat-containing protein At4g21065-like n=1 Tax=Rhizophora mucronata TaxID=61149 RepID=A0A2P2Q3W2_RHIMU
MQRPISHCGKQQWRKSSPLPPRQLLPLWLLACTHDSLTCRANLPTIRTSLRIEDANYHWFEMNEACLECQPSSNPSPFQVSVLSLVFLPWKHLPTSV